MSFNLTEPQRQCIEESYGHPSALVAGAGSGKTATLTNRIVYALEHPDISGVNDIDQVLAITFTNKAAGELRSRIKAALQVASAHEPRLAEQALKVDGAWISTIHGMCSRMLRENAFTLGIDPAFRVLSSSEQEQLMDHALEEVLAGQNISSQQQRTTAALFAEYGRKNVKVWLTNLVRTAADSSLPPSELFVCPPSSPTQSYIAEIVRWYQYILEGVDPSKGGNAEKWYNQAADALAAIMNTTPDQVMRPLSAEAEAQLNKLRLTDQYRLASLLPSIWKSPKAINEGNIAGDGRTAQEVVYPRIAALKADTATEFTQALVGLVQPVLDCYDAAKQELGGMDQGDLMRHAHRLLTNPEYDRVGKNYCNRFKLVMVDEFQDTNQMQVDMICLLSGGTKGVPSNRMCVVGDAQQSIYAFRGADLSVFQDYVRQVEEDSNGQVINMGHNFRSHAEILAFSKSAFQNTFGSGPGGSYLELIPGRKEDLAAKKFSFAGGSGALSGSEASVDAPRRINVKVMDMSKAASVAYAAETIAQDFERLIKLGHKAGDMAILLAGMPNAPVYAQALRKRDIPCAITGGSVFSTAVEPKLVIALCKALVNMNDTESLAQVLTSDLFALEAEDLVGLVPQLHKGHGRGQARLTDRFAEQLAFLEGSDEVVCDPEASIRLNNALAVLTRAATRVGSDSLSRIAASVFAESGWFTRMQEAGLPQAANVFKALRLIEQLEAEGSYGAAQLVQEAEAALMANKETPGVLSAEGDDFVRIMTIHASKGLEFPIVAVAEAMPKMHREAKFYVVPAQGRQYVSLSLGRTASNWTGKGLEEASKFMKAQARSITEQGEGSRKELFEALASDDPAAYRSAAIALDQMAEDEEYQRRMYVAYTRARDALIAIIENPAKAREAGQVTSSTEIERVLCGPDGFPLQEETEYACQLYPVHTEYVDNNKTIEVDWAARVEVFRPPVEQEDANSQDAEQDVGASDAAANTEPADTELDDSGETKQAALPEIPTYTSEKPFVVPTNLPASAAESARYRLQWSQGILSASSLKHDKAEAEYLAEEEVSESSQEDSSPCTVVGIDAAEARSTSSFVDLGTTDDTVFSPDVDDPTERPARATEKGTAFHAMGECAAHTWKPGSALSMPAEDRLNAIANLYGLNTSQRVATIEQLQSWLASPVAQEMAAHQHLVAEAPFWVSLDTVGQPVPAAAGAERGPLVLQGFIDLLAYDTFGEGEAVVVDYKTGTRLQTEEQRRNAYEIQAKVYAYALLCQGFQNVRLKFVFVEQPDKDGRPQVVEFPATGEADYTIDTLRLELQALVESIGA